MSTEKDYLDSIRLSFQVSVAAFSIYAAIYAVLLFVNLASLTSALPGNSLGVVAVSLVTTKLAEYFYKYCMGVVRYLWEDVKEIDEPSEYFEQGWKGYALFPLIILMGLLGYYFAIRLMIDSQSIPPEQFLMVLNGGYQPMEILQGLLWQILVASATIMPISGGVGFYYLLKHVFFPENICIECQEVVKASSNYCKNCGGEIRNAKTKKEQLKSLLSLNKSKDVTQKTEEEH